MTEPIMTERAALARMAQGDESGLAWLIQKYTGYVSAIVWNILCSSLSRQDAEEVVADVFMTLWQYAKAPQPERVKGYLGRIARSRAIDRLRREKFDLSLEYDSLELSAASTEEQVLAQERKTLLHQALADMPPVYREIMIRHYYYCQSPTDIAADMGMKPDTVRQRLHRGRLFLREALQEGGIFS
jgi:RNA polymerase sigma-70 factor (ECF subfamily)